MNHLYPVYWRRSERYMYNTREEREEHRKVMYCFGYVDTGLQTKRTQDERGIYRACWFAEYHTFLSTNGYLNHLIPRTIINYQTNQKPHNSKGNGPISIK